MTLRQDWLFGELLSFSRQSREKLIVTRGAQPRSAPRLYRCPCRFDLDSRAAAPPCGRGRAEAWAPRRSAGLDVIRSLRIAAINASSWAESGPLCT